jgi:hypothetical protein
MNVRHLPALGTMIAMVGLVACTRTVVVQPPPQTLNAVTSSQRVYTDDGIGFPDSARIAVRDAATWQDVWQRATYSHPNPPPMPGIDFTQEMLLVVAAGRMSPGDQIRVDSVGVRNDQYIAIVRTTVECEPFPADAYPMEIVRVRRDERPVGWVERRERAAHCS